MPATIDLHCHSSISDGVYAPKDLVDYACRHGVKVLALTDHDNLSGLGIARKAAEQKDIIFVDGVEISVTWKKRTLHIVGLKINPNYAPLKQKLDKVKQQRIKRAQLMAEGLEKAGIKGSFEGSKAIAGDGVLTRMHYARFIVESGHAKNTKAVFKRFLVKGKPGYVEHQWMSLQEAVEMIKASGGNAVIAHPGRYDLGRTNTYLLMHEFKQYGGDGIEVVTGSHTPLQYQQFADIAHKFSLKSSLGSDFHGPDISFMDMGCIPDLPTRCVPIWDDWKELDV